MIIINKDIYNRIIGYKQFIKEPINLNKMTINKQNSNPQTMSNQDHNDNNEDNIINNQEKRYIIKDIFNIPINLKYQVKMDYIIN